MTKQHTETSSDHCPLPECLVRLKNIEKNVGDIRTAVMGNGDPKKGLCDRVSRLEQTFRLLAGFITIAFAAAGVIAAVKF